MLRRSSRRLQTLHPFAEVPWLQPYPDRLLDALGADLRRETVSTH